METIKKNLFSTIFFVVFSLLTLFLFWQRFQIGQLRYFDPDEFQYLNWSYHLLTGYHPYTDFLMYITPGFPIFLSIIFIFGKGIAPLFIGRGLAFILFAALALVMSYIFYLLRRSWTAVFVPLFLAILPLPSDKFIEIRPGNLMTLLTMVGVLCHILWLKNNKKYLGFIAGFFYSLAIIVTQEALPILPVAIAILLFSQILIKREIKSLLVFLMGLTSPFIIFGLWLTSFGNLDQVIYSLTKLPLEIANFSEFYKFPPEYYFFAQTFVVFGRDGISPGLIANLILWGIGGFVVLSRFIILISNKRKLTKHLPELLLLGVFITHGLSYLFLIPVHHAQYLIPLSVFIAFYLSDLLYLLVSVTQGVMAKVGLLIFFLGLFGFFYWIFFDVHRIKPYTNVDRQMLPKLVNFYSTVPTSEYVLDLQGATIYYPYPYFACCFRLGTISQGLSRPLPPLSEALAKTKTRYIYQGLNLITTLSSNDQDFVLSNYDLAPSGLFFISKYW